MPSFAPPLPLSLAAMVWLLWPLKGNRISARFEYEWHDDSGQWYRTHGNEHWEFDERGYMRWRDMSANDVPIDSSERRLN